MPSIEELTVRIVTTQDAPWTSGDEVVASMAPLWRANLGAPDEVDRAYALYRQRNYVSRPSTRRFDVIELGPGYSDTTAAYHDTVEESLILDGTCILDGEGVFHAGDYFWRTPGWVHRSHTDTGFTALLSLEGLNPSEDSRSASRVVVPQGLAGQRSLADDEACVRRDRIVNLHTGDVAPLLDPDDCPLPWAPAGAVRVLGRNPVTRACSALVDLPAGTTAAARALDGLEAQVFVLKGLLSLGGTAVPEHSLVEFDAGESVPMAAAQATSMFVKLNVPTG